MEGSDDEDEDEGSGSGSGSGEDSDEERHEDEDNEGDANQDPHTTEYLIDDDIADEMDEFGYTGLDQVLVEDEDDDALLDDDALGAEDGEEALGASSTHSYCTMINQITLKNGQTESNAGIGAHRDERCKLITVQYTHGRDARKSRQCLARSVGGSRVFCTCLHDLGILASASWYPTTNRLQESKLDWTTVLPRQRVVTVKA
ncbi:uncharacterized protein F5891DRAFT_984802 [Suillus fuscotomentosus]|uniref:Uncharacterized protein n=1 Tax=Suillus fuscotomentosus TaxID=1912939 RepID=A0AAD4DXP8_9AGAM|nr:uncharacterized protein F5891DRAFT_984802 [Suillus fuscotomentosus]KAG1894784.1 hypothetical protein F5891DRAFT_984802 [Suillus fuscotomentosus]